MTRPSPQGDGKQFNVMPGSKCSPRMPKETKMEVAFISPVLEGIGVVQGTKRTM